MLETIKKNLSEIQEEIAPCKPKIIAITKYFDVDVMVKAYEAGLRDFGESRAVEASEKINSLSEEIRNNSKFHFIGHLQTNKVKKVIELFDYIHSVDSLRLAEVISDEALRINKTQNILLQLNNAGETQKFGFSKEEIFENFEQILRLKGIKVCGLMNMAPLEAEDNELNRLFSEVVAIRNELEMKFDCSLKEISMGMSQDYKVAAKNGSTMLRIGRKLFS